MKSVYLLLTCLFLFITIQSQAGPSPDHSVRIATDLHLQGQKNLRIRATLSKLGYNVNRYRLMGVTLDVKSKEGFGTVKLVVGNDQEKYQIPEAYGHSGWLSHLSNSFYMIEWDLYGNHGRPHEIWQLRFKGNNKIDSVVVHLKRRPAGSGPVKVIINPNQNKKVIIKKRPNKKVIIKKGPNKKVIIKKRPNKKIIIKKRPNKKIIIKKGPNKKIIIKKGPNKKVIIKKGPNKKVIIKKGPNKKVIIKKRPNKKVIIKKRPNKKVIIKKGPNKKVIIKKGLNKKVIIKKRPKKKKVNIKKGLKNNGGKKKKGGKKKGRH